MLTFKVRKALSEYRPSFALERPDFG